MIAYIVRRTLYAIPILLGVNLLTSCFSSWSIRRTTSLARSSGTGASREDAIDSWKRSHGYHKPMLYNADAEGLARVTDTIFFDKSLRLFLFEFGRSDSGRDIGNDISQRMWPSLAIALPTLVVGLLINISFALAIALFRGTRFDLWAVVVCVALLSVSSLFYIIGGQYVVSKLLHLVPTLWLRHGPAALKFLILPVLIGVVGGIGKRYPLVPHHLSGRNGEGLRAHRPRQGARGCVGDVFSRAQECAGAHSDRGSGDSAAVVHGSLLVESFFGIPGLGSYTIDGIQRQDFAIVRSMVFLGSVLYVLGAGADRHFLYLRRPAGALEWLRR